MCLRHVHFVVTGAHGRMALVEGDQESSGAHPECAAPSAPRSGFPLHCFTDRHESGVSVEVQENCIKNKNKTTSFSDIFMQRNLYLATITKDKSFVFFNCAIHLLLENCKHVYNMA